MSGHNEAFIGQISRSVWAQFTGTTPSYATALSSEFLRRHNVIQMSGGTNIALTLPDAAQSDLSGRLIWFVCDGTGAMTVEATAYWGGLASSTTLTISQGGLAPVLCGSAYYYTVASAVTLS